MVGARCEAKKTATGCVEEEPEPEKGMERVWNLKWRAAAGGIGLGSRRRELPEGGRGRREQTSYVGFAVWSTVQSQPIMFTRLEAASRLAQRQTGLLTRTRAKEKKAPLTSSIIVLRELNLYENRILNSHLLKPLKKL
jgi:hypothetical protein